MHPRLPQVDLTPWKHPFLTRENITRFRSYSEQIWDQALRAATDRPLECGFAVNMAQNMYKWAKLAQKYGASPTLYLHPQDMSAISQPQWEDFAGEYSNVLDGPGFLGQAHARPTVPCITPPNDGVELWTAYHPEPRPAAIAALRARASSVRHEPLLNLQGAYPYFKWAELLARHDVNYIASTPFPAYASGKPYCVFSVGGDLQFDCGRQDDHGRAMRLGFAHATFILASNPHTLGHCRRFGFTNAVYLPYPMDTETYSPGDGVARREWQERFGGDVFILSTARVDRQVKGHTDAMFDALARLARQRPGVRFVFLGWGAEANHFQARIDAAALREQFIILPPVGKRRLIDYYRSSDIVLDQFVYGYYGATALEAAAIGKPVVMNLRAEHYAPLYKDDVAPVANAASATAVCEQLSLLIDNDEHRRTSGSNLREWIVRTHGERTTVPLMLALLQMAANRIPVPAGLDNPLLSPLADEEREYHRTCLQ